MPDVQCGMPSQISHPVDYRAWKKGYMPPSEHLLIDQLAYRGAKVVMSSDDGERGAFWIVMRDMKPTGEMSLQIYAMLTELIAAKTTAEQVVESHLNGETE